MSSLRRGHANLLCIVPILTDDPRRESENAMRRDTYAHRNQRLFFFQKSVSFMGDRIYLFSDGDAIAGGDTICRGDKRMQMNTWLPSMTTDCSHDILNAENGRNVLLEALGVGYFFRQTQLDESSAHPAILHGLPRRHVHESHPEHRIESSHRPRGGGGLVPSES